MTERPHEQQCSKIEAAFRRATGRGPCGGEESTAEMGADYRHPLAVLMDAERALARELEEEAEGVAHRLRVGLEERLSKLGKEGLALEILAGVEELCRVLATQHFERLRAEEREWEFAEGPSPLKVVRRVFMRCKQHRPDLLRNLDFRTLGELLGCRGATLQALSKRLFGESPAGWRKSAEARKRMSESANGNVCRVGGKKVQGLKSTGGTNGKDHGSHGFTRIDNQNQR